MAYDTQEVKRYICTHIGEMHSIQDVAEPFGMTADALRMAWKRAGEQEPLGRYTVALRMAIIKSLLMGEPGISAGDAARAGGFLHESSAARSFKRETGLTMRQYQAKLTDSP